MGTIIYVQPIVVALHNLVEGYIFPMNKAIKSLYGSQISGGKY